MLTKRTSPVTAPLGIARVVASDPYKESSLSVVFTEVYPLLASVYRNTTDESTVPFNVASNTSWWVLTCRSDRFSPRILYAAYIVIVSDLLYTKSGLTGQVRSDHTAAI